MYPQPRPNDDIVTRMRAVLDQRQALLRELVRGAARHRDDCRLTPVCIGDAVVRRINDLTCHERDELLWAAIIELGDREPPAVTDA